MQVPRIDRRMAGGPSMNRIRRASDSMLARTEKATEERNRLMALSKSGDVAAQKELKSRFFMKVAPQEELDAENSR